MSYLLLPKTKSFIFSPLFIYSLSVLALCILLSGFFTGQYSSKLTERRDTENESPGRRYVDKLALIIIDALRYDFVVPENTEAYMPFMWSSISKNESCYVVTKAHSPTVTLPRLKAITSGYVSTYIDVVLNFMTSTFKDDNLIKQANSKGIKIVFYGDNTWLKLFPNSFVRSEGTNSFFANDYVEVDNNVTRNIDDEFSKTDWDIIILHYLGLDHIGHTEGPNSLKIRHKLLEMDGVVQKFYEHFRVLEQNGINTMLVVTGDHGMKDSGGHGGVTHSEVTVPVVSVGKPCMDLPGWPRDHVSLQVDLTPTLSTLLGLPIPSKSMGKIIPSLLHNLTLIEIMKSLENNRWHLRKLINMQYDGVEFDEKSKTWTQDVKAVENISRKYFEYLNTMSEDLVSSNSDFQLIYLTLGVFFMWICFIYLLLEFSLQCPKYQNFISWFLSVGTILHGFSLTATSFIEEEHQTWYFLWATFWIFAVVHRLSDLRKHWTFKKLKSFSLWILLAWTHRILRKWNQTGDKWNHLPDLKVFFHSENGQIWLFLVFLLGIGSIFCFAVFEKCSKLQLTVYGVSLLSITGFRITTGYFQLEFLSFYPPSKGTVETNLYWLTAIAFLVLTLRRKTPFYLVWLLLISFSSRPHNVVLLPVQVLVSKRLHLLFTDQFWNAVAHVWLGNVFYFYQGNGNSLSNVDVAAGFVGVQTYNPIYAGAMIAATTYNAQILAFILSPKSELVFSLFRLIPLCLYCTLFVFELHHLFIWSVFSPKLLFESSASIILLLVLVVNRLYSFSTSAIRRKRTTIE